MRKEFSKWIEDYARHEPNLVFLTGDLGYAALENVAQVMGHKFINVGVCEQNMISVAAGMAHEGFQVICYSIAPFAVFRPAEQIRLDVCAHNKNVKIVGNGGGYGYGIMGATHHAIEDLAVLSSFNNMRCLVPQSNEDVGGACEQMMSHDGPVYLRLNAGSEEKLFERKSFTSVRHLYGPVLGAKVVIVTLGPMALQARRALEGQPVSASLFSVCELPLPKLTSEFASALRQAETVWVVEEHVSRGGLAEHLTLLMAREGISLKNFKHNHALGYPNGLYGSQAYHQQLCGLSVEQIREGLGALA